MCRLCFVSPVDFEIPPIRSKFNEERFLNDEPIRVGKGYCLFESIRSVISNPCEQLALHEIALKMIASCKCENREEMKQEESLAIIAGLNEEWLSFEEAIQFLASHNPTRMKTIEQLESNYRKTLFTVKQNRTSGLASLQTRQSLEMDMLTSQSNYTKADLESLVQQHCSEMDCLMHHWDSEIRSVQQRQLREYKDLVMEVFQSERGSGNIAVSNFAVTARRQYSRPDVHGLEWLSMRAVAVRSSISHKARLVRITRMRGDFLSSLIPSKQIAEIDLSNLDPEEQCASSESHVSSALIIGVSSNQFTFRSNQDIELVRRIDTECPGDCRWPTLVEQIEVLRNQSAKKCVAKTRHSNLGSGIGTIYHIDPEVFYDELNLLELFQDCEGLGVKRIFIPSVFVADMRAPFLLEKGGSRDSERIILGALGKLSNMLESPSLDEVVIVHS